MKTEKDKNPTVVDLAKVRALSYPLVKESDAETIFVNPSYKEEGTKNDPSLKKIYFQDNWIGNTNFSDGKEKPPQEGLFERRVRREPTETNVNWQNDCVFARRMLRWLIRQGFQFDSWAINYYDPETQIIRTCRSSPSVWLSVSNKKHKLLCEIVHVHGKRGYIVRTRPSDNNYATYESKVCESIIGIKNYIKSKYSEGDDDLLDAAL